MNVARQVTEILLSNLPDHLDGLLDREGFARSENALTYSRRVEAGTQHICLIFDTNPRYAPGALAHLLPQVRLVYPSLNRRVLDMMGEMPSLEGSHGLRLNEQIQNAARREVRQQASRWYIFDRPSADQQLRSVAAFIASETIEFLNTYKSIDSLAHGFAISDERLPRDRRFLVFAVAAYTLCDELEEAMRLLDAKLGKPMLRRQYARAFQYVSNLLP